ncbi:hypothetical protein SOVF_116580 [Spinacia oleracea]|nr:hypothetical protein SOVF_116580 [Spinacia oleracea]
MLLLERFQVTTKDGYILSLQRIPTGLTNYTLEDRKPPVLLQHGVLMIVIWFTIPAIKLSKSRSTYNALQLIFFF